MKSLYPQLLFIALLFTSSIAFGQNTVSGKIIDGDSNEPLIGANVLIKGTIKGTITDIDGIFDLEVNETLPYTLIISSVGFETEEIVISENNANIELEMEVQAFLANEVVISASRTEEKIMESPVSIEKLDLIGIKSSTSADYYDEILKLKGVTNTMASLTFNTINTRGFGSGGNTRFVQLQDGMDNAAPLLNFPTGNIVGISELDIRSVELVPGAASALYGPNAFNGILLMQSKDPFLYQGLSAQIKTGVIQGEGYQDPLYNASIRYAKAFNDKWAFKINLSGLWAQDWRALDYDRDINLLSQAIDNPSISTTGSPKNPAFNGVNLYGDESFIPVAGGLRRTGWKEEDIIESNKAESFKYDAALHYRINDKIETNVSYKFGQGSSVYQGAERYALRDFSQQFAKWEIKGTNWDFKAYGSFTDDGDSYNLTALGAFINENIFPTIYDETVTINLGGQNIDVPLKGGWAVAANIASNLPGFTPEDAKQFADGGGFSQNSDAVNEGVAQQLAAGATFSGLPEPARILAARELVRLASGNARPELGSKELNDIISLVRDQRLFQKGGAGFIDNSAMYHTEGSYNLSSLFDDKLNLQVGGNLRRYSLFSDGTVFNEDQDQDGTNERIFIDEVGAYVQAIKTVADNRLKISGSLRYDKNINFKGNVTPRISLVYTAGEDREHNFRGSFQTGFRNPTSQGSFIYFPTTSILLGTTKANAEPFGIHNGGAYTKESHDNYLAALSSGQSLESAQSLLSVINMDYIQPEKLKSFELGYRGVFNKKLFVDLSGYYNIYNNFIDQLLVVNKNPTAARATAGIAPDPGDGVLRATFFPYLNVPAEISSQGILLGLDYAVLDDWKISGNYTFSKAQNKATGLQGFEDYDPNFNMPENMFNIALTNRKLIKNLGASVSYKWQQEFVFKNSFGSGVIPSYGSLNAQASYFIPSFKSAIKVGVSNILNKKYYTNVGNPLIGRMAFISITYDEFAK